MSTQPADLSRRALLVSAPLAASGAIAQWATPTERTRTLDGHKLDLETAIPQSFKNWDAIKFGSIVDIERQDALVAEVYSQTLTRAYKDPSGAVVMFLLAYGNSQSDRMQLHRPEICYTSAGFTVSPPRRDSVVWHQGAPRLPLVRLEAVRENRFEPITYWMRVGDGIATSYLDQIRIRVRFGLRGIIPDGILVRMSSFDQDAAVGFAVQDRFFRDLADTLDPAGRALLVGDLAAA